MRHTYVVENQKETAQIKSTAALAISATVSNLTCSIRRRFEDAVEVVRAPIITFIMRVAHMEGSVTLACAIFQVLFWDEH